MRLDQRLQRLEAESGARYQPPTVFRTIVSMDGAKRIATAMSSGRRFVRAVSEAEADFLSRVEASI